MAEIGDIRRFPRKQSLVAFAGVDAPPFQSGTFEAKERSISKRGSPPLRKALFQVMSCLLRASPTDFEQILRYNVILIVPHGWRKILMLRWPTLLSLFLTA